MGGRGSTSASGAASSAYPSVEQWNAMSFNEQALVMGPPSIESARDNSSIAFAYDIPGAGPNFPDDMLTAPQKYRQAGEYIDNKPVVESVRELRKLQGFPEHYATAYRITQDITPNGTTVNGGEWVTLSKTYAQQLAGNGANVSPMKVKAKDLTWDGNDWRRLGYWGRK